MSEPKRYVVRKYTIRLGINALRQTIFEICAVETPETLEVVTTAQSIEKLAHQFGGKLSLLSSKVRSVGIFYDSVRMTLITRGEGNRYYQKLTEAEISEFEDELRGFSL